MYYLLLFLGIWIMFSKFSIKIKNIKKDTDVLLSYGLLLKFHFDYDKFVNKVNILKEPKKLNMEMFNNYIKTTFLSKKLYDSLCKRIVIEEFKVYKIINIKHKNIDLFNNVFFLISLDYIKSYIYNKFSKVIDYNYMILRDDENINEFDFLFHIHIRFYHLIYLFIRYFKTIIKIIKNMREDYGQSSTHIT